MLTPIPFSWAVDGPPVGDKAVGVGDAGEVDEEDWAEDKAVGVGDAGGADGKDWYEDPAVSDVGGADWKDLDEDKGVGEGDAWWAVVETVDDGQGVVSDRQVEFVAQFPV